MFSITTIPPAIEKLNEALVLVLESAAKESSRDDRATREIELTPEMINLNGESSMLD